MKKTINQLILGTLCLFMPCALLAQAGTLDASFGTGGVATISFGNSTSIFKGAAVQPDGKIIVVGFRNGAADIVMCRYNSNGTLDNTFGTSGIVSTRAAHHGGVYRDVKILANGKIIVCGKTIDSLNHNQTSMLVGRYNANGSIDNTFGTAGFTIFQPEPGDDVAANSLAIQADGKIVAGGPPISGERCCLMRLNPDGSFDTSFGTNGKIIYLPADLGFTYFRLNTVQYLSSGKILWGGMGDDYTITLRYNTNGTLDTSFGANGIDSIYTPHGTPFVSLLPLSNGKFVITPTSNDDQNRVYLRGENGGVGDINFGNNAGCAIFSLVLVQVQ
jgi:uncharacterized delta-60 repeat protein